MALPPTSPPTSKLLHSIITEEPDARLKQLLHELQSLREVRLPLLERLKTLKDQEDLNPAPVFSEENSPTNDDALADALSELPAKILGLSQDIRFLKHKINAMEEERMKSRGKKTMHRVGVLKELLKGYDGSQAFKQLQCDLGLSPSQFTRLVKCLDKRIFEIQRCPGAQRGEKMLILK
jgi:hypothetical protein